jgi:hypothetical protein
MHNSIAGVISTLSTVYGSNKLVVAGSRKLRNLTKKRDKEYGKQRAGRHGGDTGLEERVRGCPTPFSPVNVPDSTRVLCELSVCFLLHVIPDLMDDSP